MGKNTLHLKNPQSREQAMEQITNEETEGSVPSGVQGNDTARLSRLDEIAGQTEHDQLLGELTDEPKPEEPDSETTSETEEPVTETSEEPKEELVDLVIDGETVKVPKKDIEEAGIRALQKDRAADKRLQEATALLTEAKRLQTPPPSTDAVSAQDAELVRAIQIGEPEEAAQALRKLQQQGQATPDQISMIVDARLSFTEGVKWLQNDAKDVWNDDRMRRQLVYEEQVLRQNGDSRPHIEVYKELVSDLRKWRGVAGKTFEEKRETKSNTVSEVPKANATQKVDEEDDEDDTQSFFAQQRKARGKIT